MVAEAVPQSVAYDGNLRIAFTPLASNGKSIAALGTDGVDLTYSLKSFNRTKTEEVIPDPRLTLKQNLQKRGKITEVIEVQYVFGDDDDVAAATLLPGVEGHLTVRYSEANETAWTAAQVADYITIEAGAQRKDAPVENGVQTITQTLYVTAVTEDDIALAA